MDDITLESLEYRLVLKELAALTSTPMGKELALGLFPSGGWKEAEARTLELKESLSIAARRIELPAGAVPDVRPYLSIKPGAYLEPGELIEIKTAADGLFYLKAVSSTPRFDSDFPITFERLSSIAVLRELSDAIGRAVDEKGVVRDNATARLRDIRRAMESLREGLRRLMEGLSADARQSGALQDELFTIRDDRYVLCVKAGYHNEFPGVVHGRSSSGGTFFIEPMKAVDSNNRLAILRKEERAEEVEILRRATALVTKYCGELAHGLAVAGLLDLTAARARFAALVNGVVLDVGKKGGIKITGARHPLLAARQASGGRRVLPVDIVFGEDKRVLVISGANAGGKTVALKTLGLFSLMAQSGLPVPAEEGSRSLFFDSVMADIGDRQNIADDLSTFSAHIRRLGAILGEAGKFSLVLIDEIGVGTDPAEGGALSLAVLEELSRRGSRVVVTTHLNMLKAHTSKDPAFENASVVFDETTLSPLYRLNYGAPGASLGLKIAGAYGIPEGILCAARERMEDKEGAFLDSMTRLEEEKARLEELVSAAGKTLAARKKELDRLRGERKTLVEGARKKLDKVVVSAEEALGELRARIEAHPTRAALRRGAEESLKIKEKAVDALTPAKEEYKPSEGDDVVLDDGKMIFDGKGKNRGRVVSVDAAKKTAEVAVGSLRMKVAWKRLTPAKPLDFARGGGFSADTGEPVKTSVNLLGMRAEEAVKEAMKIIDCAHMNGIDKIELIHGIGTGRLKKALDEYLKTNPLVKGFRLADPNRGGAGVTLVDVV